MEWLDLSWGGGNEPGVIPELFAKLTPRRFGLEFHIYLRRADTLAVWVLEDGRPLREAGVGVG